MTIHNKTLMLKGIILLNERQITMYSVKKCCVQLKPKRAIDIKIND